ncbi:MAG: hypothetical protein IKJ32_03895 [Clostridia bacterium]|nr:hypothetical protein [Clostridia bacterium]
MDAKKLKLLKVAAVVIFILLGFSLVTTYLRMAEVEEELKLGKIKNNNTSFVVYGDERFYFSSEIVDGKPSFKLINRNEESDTEKVIQNYANIYTDSEILAKDNKIFYYTGDNTYVYDIATGKITLFAEGKMQDLTDEWYITLYEGVLYKGIYYHNTMNTKERYPLTSDGEVQYAYQDDNNLYYIARTSKNYYALIGLNKTDLTITVYDTVQGYDENYTQVYSNNEYIFTLVNYTNDSSQYALRIIRKSDKKDKWDVKIEKGAYSYVFLNEEFITDPTLLDENIYMLRFKTNDSGEKLQDAYVKFDLSAEEISLEKPELTPLCVYEYSAEIKGAQLIIYKDNKEINKVTLSGLKEGTLQITNVYQIDGETYYKVLTDPQRRISTYIKVDSENNAEIY